jgi:hypothetical protein
MAEELIPGWEIVEQKTSAKPGIFAALLNLLAMTPMPPVPLGAVTYILRNVATGELRKVSASSKEEAQILAMQGKFTEAVMRA